MAAGGKDRSARAERERTRQYQARAEMHAAQGRRRVRDNVVAGIVGGLIILAIVGGQIVYYTLGPGAPEPGPTPSPTPTVSMPVSPSPEPSPSVTP